MTTKLAIVSDLHLDFYQEDALFTGKLKDKLYAAYQEADWVIVAGDLWNGITEGSIVRLNYFFEDIADRTIITFGNHDYWGTSFRDVENIAHKLNVKYVLQNQLLDINGVGIFGGTLWFPHEPLMDEIGNRWADFAYIADSQKIHGKYQEFIEHPKLKHADIVISHHLPTLKSVSAYYKDSEYNMYFASDNDALIKKVKPKLWVHGHTHSAWDYKLGETRIVCNPLGYPGERNGAYKPLIIEV